jgi:integrase/recombinase XerD
VKAYLEPGEVELVERAATCPRDRLLIRLLFRLGCRISELLGIRIADIDFARGIVTILHLKTRLRVLCPGCWTALGRTHQFCPGCGSSVAEAVAEQRRHRRVRMLPMDDDTREMLRDYIGSVSLASSDSAARLFGINRHRAWQIVRDCATRAGVPKLVNPETGRVRSVSPHRLRDSFAVHAVKTDDSGDGLRLLQEHLGHASFNTTARYRKVAGDEHREWYQKLWH